MKKHLKEIGLIITKFIRKYDFNSSYFRLEGVVHYLSHGRLNVNCMREFDEFTVAKVKEIESDIYEQIRNYLSKNKIEDTLYIETQTRGWASDGVIIHFRIKLKVSNR